MYIMRIDFKNKILFLCNPKTGSTSTRDLIDKTFINITDNNKNIEELNRQNKLNCSLPYHNCHSNAIIMKEIIENNYNEKFKDFFVFTFIRNPWAKLVSLYKYSKCDINGLPFFNPNYDESTAGNFSFRDYLLSININNYYWNEIGSPSMAGFCFDKDGKTNLVNNIYKLEDFNLEKLENDISIHLNKLNNFNNNIIFKFNSEFPFLNFSEDTKDYKLYYKEEWMIILVSILFKSDIEFGNYKFNNDVENIVNNNDDV